MKYCIPAVFFSLLLFSCRMERNLPAEGLNEMCAPYDQFAANRAYPSFEFDWNGWQANLASARMRANPSLERNPGCGGNPTSWALQGPGNVGGRVNTLAVKPDDELTVLAGFAGGGIFKSIDGGVNWHPVFDEQAELAIGDLTYDPVNPNIVYAGTGDVNIPAIVFNGKGVYKSTDGGEHWQYAGLEEAGIISKVVVNPLNHNEIYAAAMGNPYVRDTQRGIYKSSDGGAHWTQVLFVSNQAGASDLLINPANPLILYASFWDRIRSNQESTIFGPHAKVYKSIDGGNNWTPLGGGLPTGIMGRTGLVMSATNPDKLYVLYVDTLSRPGGLYRTVNGGATWTTVNIAPLINAYSDFGWYFGKIRLNPDNDEEIYLLGVLLWRRVAASGTWQNAAGGHADSHDLVLLPSGRRYWANDGGVYRSPPGQSYYTKCLGLPTTQLYHTDYNPHHPNVYYIGAQDNGIQKGNGAGFNSWEELYTADGFNCAFDPVDSNTFWIEIQYGRISKTTDGGFNWQNGTDAFNSGDRVNWDAPFFMSALTPPKRYGATYRVYESIGDAYTAISPDLTDGVIYGDRFHNISALAESPLLAGKLLAGTSDGNVWRRAPGGNWTNISAGLPDRYISAIVGSADNPARIFLTHNGFRDNDTIPHVFRSDDDGQHWVGISGDLPNLPVSDIWVMGGQSDQVLFVANDGGVYFTKNGGQHWERLGAGLPFVPVFDLEYNPVRKELLAATFARGLYTFPIDSVLQQGGQTVSLAGNIHTETGIGVEKVLLGPNSSTDTSGNFVVNVPGCSNFSIIPQRKDDPLNGVSTYDLVLISRHILNLTPLPSPYSMIAADANKSNSITNFDIITIRKLILGIDTIFPNNDSWRFIPADFVFPNPLNPFQTPFPEQINGLVQMQGLQNQDMIGIKTGDVNQSVDASSGASDARSAPVWPLFFQDRVFRTGDTFAMTLNGGLEALSALQFTFVFDSTALECTGLEPLYNDLEREQISERQLKKGIFTLACETMPGGLLRTDGRLMNLYFRAKKEGNLRNFLTLSSEPTPALAYGRDGTVYQPALRTLRPDGNPRIVWAPNPVARGTETVCRIEPNDPDGHYHLMLWDGLGRLIWDRHSGMPTEGFRFSVGGVYFYKVVDLDTSSVWVGKLWVI